MLKNKIISAIQKILKKITLPNSALKQVSFVAGGVVVAQALNVFILPILSRIYSPADYGVMAVYSSVIAILSEISGFRYHLAIPLPKQKRYASALVSLSIIIQIVFVSIISIILFVCGGYILKSLSMEVLISYKYLIPLGLLAVGFYNILIQWAIRESLFSVIGRTKISQCLFGAVAKIGIGMLGYKPLGLLIGVIIAQASGITTLAHAALKKDDTPLFNKKNMRRVAYRYRKFPMYSTWFGVVNSAGANLPQLLLSSFYSFNVAGLYAIASSLLFLPSAFIGQAMGQVFIQRASVAKQSGNIADLSFRSYFLLLQVGFFPIALISFFAPRFFVYFLGARWGTSGIYAIVLVPFIAYNFAYSPLSMLYVILDKQETALLHEFIYTICRILSFLLGLFSNNPIISVLLYSLSCFCVQFFRIVYLLSIAGNNRTKIVVKTIKIISEALMLLIFPLLCYLLNTNVFIDLSVIIVVSLAYFYRSFQILSKEGII